MKVNFNLNLDTALAISDICSAEDLFELTESGYKFIDARLKMHCVENGIEIFASGDRWLLVHEDDI